MGKQGKKCSSTRGLSNLVRLIRYVNYRVDQISPFDPFYSYKRLWAEVLILACKDALMPNSRLRSLGRRIAAQHHAQKWFYFDSSELGSFNMICLWVNLDKAKILGELEGGSIKMDRAA